MSRRTLARLAVAGLAVGVFFLPPPPPPGRPAATAGGAGRAR
jgi:hypothetical protein